MAAPRSRLTIVALAAAVSLAGAMAVAIVVQTAALAVRAYFTVPFADEWALVPLINETLGGHWDWSAIWAQHNEHRLALYHLLAIADAAWWHGEGKLSLAVAWLMDLGTAALIAAAVLSSRELSRAVKLFAVPLILGCAVSGTQIENFWLPIGATNFAVNFFALALFLALALGGRSAASFAAAAVLAVLATLGSAQGLAVWPIAWGLILLLGRGRGWLAGWAALGIAMWVLYMIGYQRPIYHADPLASLHHPVLVLRYLVLYFGAPFSWFGLRASAFAGLAIGLLFAGAVALRAYRRRAAPAEAFLVAAAVFVLATGVLTALGRLNFPAEQAQSSRYDTPVLLFWAATALLYLFPAPAAEPPPPIAWHGIAFGLVLLSGLLVVERSTSWIEPLAAEIRQGGILLVLGLHDPKTENFGVPADIARNYAKMLASHDLSVFHEAREAVGLGDTVAERFREVPADMCEGRIETTAALGDAPGVRVEGWAWEPAARRVPPQILLADSAGRIVGWALSGYSRRDKPAAAQDAPARSGFVGYAALPAGSPLRAFALDRSAAAVCPLSGG